MRTPDHRLELLNDDVNSFEYVVGVLMLFLNFPEKLAYEVALQTHELGSCSLMISSEERCHQVRAELESMKINSKVVRVYSSKD